LKQHEKIEKKRKEKKHSVSYPGGGQQRNYFDLVFFFFFFWGIAYQGKDIVFKFIIEYTSLRDFGP
jgi:hypothetical protein